MMMKTTAYSDQEMDLHLFLSRLTHEIRNPLAMLSAQLQLLEEHHTELSDSREWEDILSTLSYLNELFQELSSYKDAGLLHMEPGDLSTFLEGLVSAVRPRLEYLNISLQYCSDGNLPVLSGDRLRLRQALLNLIRNAQESILPPGEIRIEAFSDRGHVYLSVIDTGSGIPEEYLETLFDPFVTHKNGGTGLGLAIVRQVVEAHEGEIQIRSIPGQGTTFSMIFPIR